MNLLRVSREVGEFRKRYKWMALGVATAFAILYGRILYLQVIGYSEYAAIAQENILKTIRLPATRGIIRDAQGRVVAQNRPAYRMYVTPSRLRSREEVSYIAELLGLDAAQTAAFVDRLANIPEHRRTHQIELISELSREQMAALETHARELPAVDVLSAPVRDYPFGSLGAHAIGYLNEINAEELEKNRDLGYRAGETLGRSGVERSWEAFLRGRRGFKRVYVDARGRRSRVLTQEPDEPMYEAPVPGRDLTLTLDMDLMGMLERSFRSHPSGAAVVVDVHTGKVRALFSKPAYDLNEMSGKLSVARAKELNESEYRPLIDKTLYDTYYPGSTFKPISALSALEDGILDAKHEVDCVGFYKLGKRHFRCEHVHNDISMRNALTRSCNVYFYRLAELVGMDRIAHYAKELGLGEKTGVSINTESRGLIPTKDWYQDRGAVFRIGYTLNAAIGQGDTRVTLIQLAMAYAAIANGGTLHVPQLVESMHAPDGTLLEQFSARVRRKLTYKPEHIALIHSALWGVVNEEKGTASSARLDDAVSVAGKTGTAQVERYMRRRNDEKRSWYQNRPHAWFAGWAPAEDPELAIVVLVEHGGAGGKNAAPIATAALKHYFERRMGQTALTTQGGR